MGERASVETADAVECAEPHHPPAVLEYFIYGIVGQAVLVGEVVDKRGILCFRQALGVSGDSKGKGIYKEKDIFYFHESIYFVNVCKFIFLGAGLQVLALQIRWKRLEKVVFPAWKLISASPSNFYRLLIGGGKYLCFSILYSY